MAFFAAHRGRRIRTQYVSVLLLTFSIPWPGVGCSLLFLTYSPLTSPPGLCPEADTGLYLGNLGEQVFSQGQELP